MGYGPGVILYTVFGIMAGYGGFLLWRMFLGLDSDRYPLKTYGDIAFRVFGSVCRYVVNTVQSVQVTFSTIPASWETTYTSCLSSCSM